jgi:hypothetical protein
MSIVRRRHTANFTTIANEVFEDERLAADELGVLAWLRSRPNNWEVRRWALGRRFNMGRERLARVFQNLIATGWIVAERMRLADGTLRVDYVVNDTAGSALTIEEVKAVLSVGVGSDHASFGPDTDVVDPPTAQPATADPYVVSLYLQKTESQTKAIALDAGASRPVYTDSRHELWGEGVQVLVQLGVPDRAARSNIGRWLKDAQDNAQSVLGAIQRARDARVFEPIPWITRALKSNIFGTGDARDAAAHRKNPPSGHQAIGQDAVIAVMGRKAADIAARRQSARSGDGQERECLDASKEPHAA